jgi:hypothetical protein
VSTEVIDRNAAISSAVSTEVIDRNAAISSAVSAEVIDRNTAISNAINSLVDGAPSALDTLNEIASALNSDGNLAGTLTSSIASVSSAVSAEAVLRASAVSTEVIDRNAAISAAVSAEVIVRNTAITSAVSTEVIDRNTAISAAVSAEGIVRNTAISNAINSLVAGAPSALDTLNEIASALNSDGNLAGTLTSSIASVSSAVSAEAVLRASAVSTEVINRNAAISAAVSAEVIVRNTAITSAVSAETAARASAITSAVSVETAARTSALSVLYDSVTQRGGDINGEATHDESGYSVSLSADGSIVAIGAIKNYGNGNNSGHVRVYAWNSSSSSWVQRGADIDGEAANNFSGYSVSLSADGSIVAIGAVGNYGGDTNAGHVRVYAYNGTSWVQRGGDIDGEAAYDESGWSVSLSADGSVVAIGANGNDGNGNSSGHVRVYQYDTTKTTAQTNDSLSNFGPVGWNRLGNDIDGEAASAQSGYSVSLSANGYVVAIGAVYNDGNNGASSGHVRVYAWTGTSWVQRGADIDGEVSSDFSGCSVSLSADDGSIVAIGAINNDSNGTNSGHVRVYAYNETSSSWVQRGAEINGEVAGDQSGFSVSLSANGLVLAIGALVNSSYRGHVRVYAWNSVSLTWIKRLNDIDGEALSDESGQSVSLSADGSIVAIGAIKNDGNGNNSGHVRVYEYNESIQTQIDTVLILKHFATDSDAANGGVALYALYRTGNVVKIRMA